MDFRFLGQTINDYWNNFGKNFMYGKCKVQFNIKTMSDSKHDSSDTALKADNYVYVEKTKGFRSYVKSGQFGNWWNDADLWVSAHEAGHLFGLKDDYHDQNGVSVPNKGHKGHIMGDYEGKVSQHEINDILKDFKCMCK